MKSLKSNTRVTYRPSTQEDIVSFYGYVPVTMRCMSFFIDGELFGFGGYRLQGGIPIIFTEMKKDIDVSKMTIWRCMNIGLKFVDKHDIDMYAVADNPALLERLGFSCVHGDTYKMEKI